MVTEMEAWEFCVQLFIVVVLCICMLEYSGRKNGNDQ